MITNTHPIHYIRSSILKKTPSMVLEFSRYVYLTQGRTESREIFSVEAGQVDMEWLNQEIDNLTESQELAFHSKIQCNSSVFHIPMVDFVNTASVEDVKFQMGLISKKLCADIRYYNSGRSLHGYFLCSVNEKQWYEFLGSLLLCNSATTVDQIFIDSRWIGHSLEHGFSALRWSHNSGMYKSLPRIIK
ncbi:MAG: hypothetical protein ABI977_26490 [Acidobacteriota bacterium]